MAGELEEGDVVLCTVDRIRGTVIFVRIHLPKNIEKEGSIILSEIAPGRIRNIRNYVVPKKKIVCKVLRISGDKIDLSLRRVTKKEKEEVLNEYKKEKSYKSILKGILKEKSEEAIRNIEKEDNLSDFLEKAKEKPKELEKVCGKSDAKKILDVLKKQKQKKAVIKREITLKTTKPNGIELIKKILGRNIEARYISAGRYSIKTETGDMKSSDRKMKEILESIEKKAKKEDVEFEIKEKGK